MVQGIVWPHRLELGVLGREARDQTFFHPPSIQLNTLSFDVVYQLFIVHTLTQGFQH